MINKLRDQINSVFVGKETAVDNAIICLLAGGHLLIEDVPGVGKTTLAKTLAQSVSASFGRIQFTPDTLPGDILGTSIFNMSTREFEFHEGIIMNQIILADEINRTSPKTQAGMLEAMAEKQVSVDEKVIELPELFMVIATQNPSEFIGTYPLPEAQLDRFLMRISIGYPSEKAELLMAKNHIDGVYEEKISPVCSAEDIIELRKQVKKVEVSDSVLGYIRNLVDMTRNEKRLVNGASPRAFLALVDAARARAFLEGRDFVKPDDVKAVAINVLIHRLSLTPEAKIMSEDLEKVIRNIIVSAKIPMHPAGEKNVEK